MEESESTTSSRTFRSYAKERGPKTGCDGSFDLSTSGSVIDSSKSTSPSRRSDATRIMNEIVYGSIALIMRMFVGIGATPTKKGVYSTTHQRAVFKS